MNAPIHRMINVHRPRNARVLAGAALVVAVGAIAAEQMYVSADERERPATSRNEILPERFLRGYDPITVYYADNVGPASNLGGRVAADDPSKYARLRPSWPGAWTWLDKKTLQFKPAEPWPALQRFNVEAEGASRVLSTMMTAPMSMTPADGADNLRPFRTVTLTFPQALPVDALQQMLRVEVRDLPGLGDSARVIAEKPSIAELPRASHKDPATYAITLDDDVGEGKQLVLTLALALGDEGKSLWTGRASTRGEFALLEVACAGDKQSVVGGPKAPKESALDCGSQGELPQLVFSAAPGPITLTALKKLVRLEPSVADLRASAFGNRVQLEGKLVPDTLYKMKLASAPITDGEGRALKDAGDVELYFYVGWKRPFLRLKEGQSMLEQRGPRMIPLVGYGEPRADVRVHRIDPLHTGLWPFPANPVVINEETPPPFPGEEPPTPALGSYVDANSLTQHLRMLGSPLVSRVFDMPLLDKSGTTSFGLEIGPALDAVVGSRRPGTYLVGMRRLQGAPDRAWTRVQITNMSLTTAEERGKAIMFVRALDTAQGVSGAKISLEAFLDKCPDKGSCVDKLVVTTDNEGRVEVPANPRWSRIVRVVVEKGEDVLVFDPNDPPAKFFNNHWSSGSGWLAHLTAEPPQETPNDRSLGFVVTERPIYRPGEKVFIKGWARDKRNGVLVFPVHKPPTPTPLNWQPPKYTIKVNGPGGQEWSVPTTQSAQWGFDATWEEKDPPTGRYTTTLFVGGVALASRSFQVEAYRVPTFEVQLTGPLRARLDAPFKVKAMARYYAGGSVANEKIKWTVTREPHHHVPKGREGFLFASSSQFARPETRAAEERTEKTAELDDDGADEIEVNPALDLDGSPRVYTFEATVTGADNQEVTSTTEVYALPPFTLGMKLPRYSKKAITLEPEIIAVGVDDKLLPGQKVTVRLYKRTWHSHLRESQFATGQASYVTEQEDTKLAELDVTTAASAVKAKLPVAEAGVYIVEIVARDKLGRVQTLNADLYIGGREPVAWQKGNAGVFELAPDKEKYKPGDTANVIVKSPFNSGRALVVVEEPRGNRYSFVNVEGGQATVPVPIAREHTPNLPVHVILMRGRLGESATDDAPYRPQTMAASLDLKVEPAKNIVKVDVKHPEQARPGDTIDVGLTLTDDKGAGVGGEVTLWLVDEAVLSLAAEAPLDPLRNFVVQNQRLTSVSDTRNRIVGRLLEEETPGGDGAENDMEGTMPSRRVRKNFQTVPYYQATLTVPSSGKLSVKVPLSDDLTNFRVRAIAVSGSERFGLHESTLKVRLPVLVQPQLPRFVRQGDRFDGGGVARLVEGSEGAGVVKMEISGPVDARKRSKDVSLTLKKAESAVWPIEIKPAPATENLKVRVDVVRKSDGVGDAFEVTIPVLPDRDWEESTSVESWPPGTRTLAALSEAPRPGTVKQNVIVTNVPGLLEVMAALEYTEEYPHGCLEQKMSRLAPQLVLAQLGPVLGAGDFASAVRAHVARFIAEMPQHQDESGLYGYWPGSAGDVQLTSDAIEFAVLAELIGVKLDEKSKTRAVDALRKALRSDYGGFVSGYRYNMQTAALRSLFAIGSYDEHYLVDLFRTRREMDITSRTELALAMLRRRAVFDADLKTARDELWGSVVFNLDRGKKVYVGLSDPRRDWGGVILGSSTSTLASVLEALVEIDPKNPDNALLFDGLLRQARGGRSFGSTYDNRRAVSAIVTYLEKADIGKKKSKVVLADSASKKQLAELVVDDKPKLARTTVINDAPLTVTTTGDTVTARVRKTWLPAAGGDRVASLREGFIAQRATTTIFADGSAPVRKDDVRGAEQTYKIGDIVEVHATMTTDIPRAHVAFTVPFAAGFEPLNPELKTSSSEAQPTERDSIQPLYVQRLDHEVRYYFRSLPKGTYSFHFRLKATTPGSYCNPPPIAELMYDRAVRGRGDGTRVIISAAQEPTP